MNDMMVTSTPLPSTESPPMLMTFVISVLIAMFGTITNALSLSYFIIKLSSETLKRNEDATTTKLFGTLNVFDLSLSVSAAIFFISVQIDYNKFS